MLDHKRRLCPRTRFGVGFFKLEIDEPKDGMFSVKVIESSFIEANELPVQPDKEINIQNKDFR